MYRTDTSSRYLERIIRLIAGLMIIIATALVYFISPWRLLLHLAVGINLIIFALTGYCIMAHILHHGFGLSPRITKS